MDVCRARNCNFTGKANHIHFQSWYKKPSTVGKKPLPKLVKITLSKLVKTRSKVGKIRFIYKLSINYLSRSPGMGDSFFPS